MGKKADLLDDALRRLRSWLASRDEFGDEIIESLNGPASKGEVNRAGSQTGGKLPEGVQALYLRIGGQSEDRSGDLENIGIFPSLVADEPTCRLLEPDAAIDESPTEGVLAIASAEGGNLFLVDTRDGDARLLQYLHDHDKVLEVAESVEAFFAQLADDLETGAIEIDEERGLHRPEAPEYDEDDLDDL